MAVYVLTFICLMFVYTGPPYVPSPSSNDKKPYMMYSFSIPSCACFVVIFISTSFLVTKLRSYRNQSWLKAAVRTKSDDGEKSKKAAKKEQKAARFVVIICTMYLVCFAPNAVMFVASSLILPNLQLYDPYLGRFT